RQLGNIAEPGDCENLTPGAEAEDAAKGKAPQSQGSIRGAPGGRGQALEEREAGGQTCTPRIRTRAPRDSHVARIDQADVDRNGGARNRSGRRRGGRVPERGVAESLRSVPAARRRNDARRNRSLIA